MQQLEESRRIARLGVYELDVDTGKWTTSAILDEVFGIETDSVHKSNVSGWLELVHPDDRDHMRHYFENEVLCHHASFDMQYRIIRPCDQQIRWVHGLGELAFNHQGEVVRMAGTIGCQPCNTRELPI